ncbi:MAG: hypothetical protein AB8E82_04615 [Aureispira sp.]
MAREYEDYLMPPTEFGAQSINRLDDREMNELQDIRSINYDEVGQMASGQFGGMAPTSAEQQMGEQESVNSTGIPDNLKAAIEYMSGYSLDHLRVHYNSEKPEMLGMSTYTENEHLYIATGAEDFLARELWRVTEQLSADAEVIQKDKEKAEKDKEEIEKTDSTYFEVEDAAVQGELAKKLAEQDIIEKVKQEIQTGQDLQSTEALKEAQKQAIQAYMSQTPQSPITTPTSPDAATTPASPETVTTQTVTEQPLQKNAATQTPTETVTEQPLQETVAEQTPQDETTSEEALTKTLSTDKLNVVGEIAAESLERGEAERLLVQEQVGGTFWEQADFEMPVGDAQTSADPLTFQLIHSLQDIANLSKGVARSKSGHKGAAELVKLVWEPIFELIPIAEKQWDALNGIAYPGELNDEDLEIRDDFLQNHMDQLDELKDAYTFIQANEKKPIKELDKLVYNRHIIAINRFIDDLNENTVTIAAATRLRSKYMHKAAEDRAGEIGVWKIGQEHVDNILAVLEKDGEEPSYNLLTKEEFDTLMEQSNSTTDPLATDNSDSSTTDSIDPLVADNSDKTTTDTTDSLLTDNTTMDQNTTVDQTITNNDMNSAPPTTTF